MQARAVAGGFALAVTPGFNVANVGAVAEQVSRDYGVGLAVVGLFTTGLFVTHAALQVPMGRLCDRIGARLVGAAGLAIVAVASAAVLGWREAWFAIGMRTLAGCGTAAAFVGGSDYVRATIGSPVAQGIYGAVSMAAGGLAIALLPLWGTWQAPFIAATIVAGAGVVLVLAAPSEPARPPRSRELPNVLDRRLLPLGAMHAASFGVSVVLGNWVVSLLHRAGGVSEHVAGFAGGLVLFLGVLSRPRGGPGAGGGPPGPAGRRSSARASSSRLPASPCSRSRSRCRSPSPLPRSSGSRPASRSHRPSPPPPGCAPTRPAPPSGS